MGKGWRRLAVTVALAVVAAACTSGGGGKAAPGATSTTPSTTSGVTTTTVDPTKAAILAAYRAHWDDVIAVDTVFPIRALDPRIGNHVMGKQLTSERAALTRLDLVGHFERGATEFAPTVTAITGNIATVSDCLFDHSVEVDYQTNMPVENPDVGRTLDIFTLMLVNGSWLVADSMVIKSGKTGDACTPLAG
jgi:hypothetical protein